MGKKKNYESPFIKVAKIEVESSFAAGSVMGDDKSKVISSGQEVGNTHDTVKDGDIWGENDWN